MDGRDSSFPFIGCMSRSGKIQHGRAPLQTARLAWRGSGRSPTFHRGAQFGLPITAPFRLSGLHKNFGTRRYRLQRGCD